MVFAEGEEEWRNSNKWDRDVDVLVLLNSDLWKQQSRGDRKNNIHEEWN